MSSCRHITSPRPRHKPGYLFHIRSTWSIAPAPCAMRSPSCCHPPPLPGGLCLLTSSPSTLNHRTKVHTGSFQGIKVQELSKQHLVRTPANASRGQPGEVPRGRHDLGGPLTSSQQ